MVLTMETDTINFLENLRANDQIRQMVINARVAGAKIVDLDLEAAGAVAALSAASCVPVASCNGGAFGGTHSEGAPVVAFYCRPAALALGPVRK